MSIGIETSIPSLNSLAYFHCTSWWTSTIKKFVKNGTVLNTRISANNNDQKMFSFLINVLSIKKSFDIYKCLGNCALSTNVTLAFMKDIKCSIYIFNQLFDVLYIVENIQLWNHYFLEEGLSQTKVKLSEEHYTIIG